jgi:signal transduction histidine kinase
LPARAAPLGVHRTADDERLAVAYRCGMNTRATDLALVTTVAAAMTLTISVAQEEGAERSPDGLAYALGLAVAALLLARRRWPLGVLVATLGLLMAYYSSGFPAFSPAIALAAAAYWAAVAGRLLAAAPLLGGFMAFAVGYQTAVEGESLASVLGTHVLTESALIAAVLLLGEAVRHRRAWAAEVRARLRREGERRAQEERLRIARELHDVMAHTVAAIGVQASMAAEVLHDAPGQADAALRAIRAQSREAMTELRAAVGVLRDEAPNSPAPGLRDLDALVGTARAAGVAVELSVDGAERALPGAIDLTAYRIVQELLTNVVRHAGAGVARVALRYAPDEVALEIADDGCGGNGAPPDGHGLVGMRERAAAVGGTLAAGPAPGGGFRVSARLPIGRPA